MLKKLSTEGESGSLLTRVSHKHELAMVRAEGMKGWEEATGENAHAPRVGEALTSPLRFPHRAGRCFISLLTWDIPGVRNGLAKWDPVASHSSESHTEHREADPTLQPLQSLISRAFSPPHRLLSLDSAGGCGCQSFYFHTCTNV